MSLAPGGTPSTAATLRKILVPALVAAVTVLLFFVYGSIHREPEGAAPGRHQVDAQEKLNAKSAIESCRDRAKALPAGSGEAKIAQDACQQMQAQYEQTYRLAP